MLMSTSGEKLARIVVSVALMATVAVFIGFAADASGPKMPELSREKPLWSVDLHTFGFARDHEPTLFFFGTHATVSRIAREAAVSFSSAGAIAVAFNTVTENSKGNFVPGTFKSYLLAFDAATGKSTGSQSVEVASVKATRSGNFLIDSGNDRLSLYSPRLEKLNGVDLSFLGGGYFLSFSFNGDDVFIRSETADQDGRYSVRTIDAETFKQLSIRSTEGEALSDGGQAAWAVSTDYFAKWQQSKEIYSRTLSVRSEGTDWKEVYKDPACGPPFYMFSAYFLTDTRLVIQSCNKLTVTDTEGRLSFADAFPSKSPLETTLGASSNGQRFAISLGQWKGVENQFLDLGRHSVPWRLVIYDTERRAAIASFAIPWSYSFALSPDGRELALLRSGILELFRLPAAK